MFKRIIFYKINHMLKYNPTNAKFYYSVIIVVILNHYKNVVFLVFDCLRHIKPYHNR
mgnify:CR=1 FL=1